LHFILETAGRNAGRKPVRKAQLGKKCKRKASLPTTPPLLTPESMHTTACSALH
jgi:hypothetical protein